MEFIAPTDSRIICVEVAYTSSPDEIQKRSLHLPMGSTVFEAAQRSRLATNEALRHATLGVFGKIKTASTTIQDGDRVEIYRSLVADPKQARRKRASLRRSGD